MKKLDIKKKGDIIYISKKEALRLLDENRREYEKRIERNKYARANVR